MKITFYHSFLCPRCAVARKNLREIAGQRPDLEIAEIDITGKPLAYWRQGIKLIPALEINGKFLSGVFLSKKRIQMFIDQCK